MTKKALEVKEKRVSIGPLVLPGTKAALAAAAKHEGVSVGAVIDEAMRRYGLPAEAEDSSDLQGQVSALSEAIEEAAVTAGICNGEVDLNGPQLLLLCEDLGKAALAGVTSVKGTPASPWAIGRLRHYIEAVWTDLSPLQMFDKVVEFFDDAFEPKPKTVATVEIPVIQNPYPRKETAAERDRREREGRAADLDPVQDGAIDRSDEFVSG